MVISDHEMMIIILCYFFAIECDYQENSNAAPHSRNLYTNYSVNRARAAGKSKDFLGLCIVVVAAVQLLES